MSREMTSDQSSIHDGAGYDEVFQSGCEPAEGLSWSSERETSTPSSDGEVGSSRESEVSEDGGEEKVDDGDQRINEEKGSTSDGDGTDGDEETLESTSGAFGDDCPFILPPEWSVNKFLPTMLENVFKSLRSRYQIPDDIPIRLPEEGEGCYSRRTADVGMYDAMFAAGLRLPLTALHRQLANFLGISVSQIAPNAWRTFIGAEILWGRLSVGNRQLTLDEFFWCYRPQHILSSKGVYHFAVREKELKLVSDMLDSNRKWKGRYLFVEGTNWVCRQEEWESMPNGFFDNTWAYVRNSSWSRRLSYFVYLFGPLTRLFFISANNRPRITVEQEDFIC